MTSEPCNIVIAGAGIIGPVLALALKTHVGITAEIYEQASGFHDDVGAGMGLYANGLRVIRDVSPSLFQKIREAGHPYLYRRWERHDGTEVAVAEEKVLAENEEELESIGIRRFRLQSILYEALMEEGIKVHFGKRISTVTTVDKKVEITFEDGTTCLADILFGADGSKSKVRESVAANGVPHKLEYTGVTCIMGIADLPRSTRGVCFPTSQTTKCHGCYFPTSEDEQCFQLHFPTPPEQADQGNWGTLSQEVGKEECNKLANRLEQDGWHEKYLEPLRHVSHSVRIGFCLLEPRLDKLVYEGGRVVLLGDAAHPPVPYIGQGAQMGLEDAGVISMLMKKLCVDGSGVFDVTKFGAAMKIYEKMRIPRTTEILNKSKLMGNIQQKRALNRKYNEVKEELIQRDVFFHESLPVMFPGATYDYKADVESVLENEPEHLPVLEEE